MGLLNTIKERFFRKIIYSDDHNVIYKMTSKKYFLRNSGMYADIQLHLDKDRLVVLFKVRTASYEQALINFSILYDKSNDLDTFIIKHCNENPIFLIDARDIASIKKCTVDIDGNHIFINKQLVDQSNFQNFLSDTRPNKTLHSHTKFPKDEFYMDEAVESNKNVVILGSDYYQIIKLKKKKITNSIQKTTLRCACHSSGKLIDIFTIYDINNVVFVLNNFFDMTRLVMDREWILYTDTDGLNTMVGGMFHYLNLYVDITSPPILFYRNSPCKLAHNKNYFIIEYIDGYYSSKVTIKISKQQRNDVVFESEEISRINMNSFFYDVLKKIAVKAFTLCLRNPSKTLLSKLNDLGFYDCTIPLNHDIIEVVKMYDYE